jgi:hypothetical protein
MQQFPLTHTNVANITNTFDSSNVANLRLMDGMQVGSRVTSNSYHNPSNPPWIAPPIGIHFQHPQEQSNFFPTMRSTRMDALNSLSLHDSSVPGANFLVPSTCANYIQSSKVFGAQALSTEQSRHATPPLPIDKDLFSQGESHDNGGFVESDGDDDLLSLLGKDDSPDRL